MRCKDRFLIIEQHSTSCWTYTNTAGSSELWPLAPSTFNVVKTHSMAIYDVELRQNFSGSNTINGGDFAWLLGNRVPEVWGCCGILHSHRSQARSLWFKELAVLVMTCVYGSYSHLRISSRRDTENPSENKTGPCLWCGMFSLALEHRHSVTYGLQTHRCLLVVDCKYCIHPQLYNKVYIYK